MTHAGETVGRAVGTGVRTLRRSAVHAGHAGAEAAARATTAVEHKLAESGQEAAKELMATTKRAKRDLAKTASRKAGQRAQKTGRRMQDTIGELTGARKRRRWPWLLAALGVAAAGTAVVVATRKPAEPVLTEEPQEQDRSSGNGTAPEPRQEPKELNRKT